MFPIRDHNPSGRTPYVTWALVAVNVVVFLGYWLTISDERTLMWFFLRWGVVPAAVSQGEGWIGLLTSMFLHGGWMHLIGNMLFLWIFGDNMEDAFGHLPFLLYYLAGGLAAAALQIAAEPASTIPMVGASGAIAAVLGGYLLLFPRARVDVLFIIVVIIRVVPIPAFVVLGLWFAMQLVGGFNTPSDGGGVAYWAHAGGFLAGLALAAPWWLVRGGPAFWRVTRGAPPHPETRYRVGRSRIPVVVRRR